MGRVEEDSDGGAPRIGLTWSDVAGCSLVFAPDGRVETLVQEDLSGPAAVIVTTSAPEPDGHESEQIWALVQQAANRGLSGLVHQDSGVHLQFVSRLEESANPYPSAVLHAESGSFFGPLGEFRSEDLWVPWRNFERLDSVGPSLGDALESPFLGWASGEPLFEIRQGEAQIMLGDLSMEHPWPSRWGTFALFSNPSHAREVVARGIGAHAYHHPMGFKPAMGGVTLEIAEVVDFAEWTRKLGRIRSRTPVIFDPLSPRPFVGLSTTGSPVVRTVTGLWRFSECNRVAREQSWTLWSGRDTLFWPGSSGVRQTSITTSTARKLPEPRRDVDSDAHAEFMWGAKEPAPQSALDSFLLCLSDPMDDLAQWMVFPNFPQAARWLADYESSVDRLGRVQGVLAEHGLGRAGSGHEETESHVGESLVRALKRLVRTVASRGYAPALADQLAAATNAVLTSARVDVAGYTRDVLWRSTQDTVWFDRILEVLEGEALEAQAWLDGAGGFAIDGAGDALAIERLGPELWGALQPRSRYFIATALASLSERTDEARDSSPIVLEVTKALEVELGFVYEGFRERGAEEDITSLGHDPDDPNDEALFQFVRGRKLTLGQMTYLLKAASQPSPLRQAFGNFLDALPTSELLRSSKFRRNLQRIALVYRNGAAHDSPMTRTMALEAVSEVLGNDANSILATVVASRARGPLMEQNWTFASGWVAEHTHLHKTLDYRDIDDAGNMAIIVPPAGNAQHEGTFADLGEIPRHILSELEASPEAVGHPSFVGFVSQLSARWASQDQIVLENSPLAHFVGQVSESLLLEALSPIGVLWEDDAHVVARVAPQLIVAVEERLFWIFGFAEDMEDDVIDACQVSLDARSVASMAKALSRGRVSWRHPKRLVEISQLRPDDDMEMRLQRAPAPGGTIAFTIPAPGAAALRQVIARAQSNAYGRLRDRADRPPNGVPRQP